MLRVNCYRLAVCLLGALVMVNGSGRAEAELVISGTTVQPTGDPTVLFDFQLALNPGVHLASGNSIELLSVPDVVNYLTQNGQSYDEQYVYVSGANNYSSDFTLSTTSNGHGTYDITLTYTGSDPTAFDNTSGSSPLSIGDLYVVTTIDYPVGGSPPDSVFDPIYYNSVATDSNGDPDTVTGGMTTPAVVPEPASIALIGLGLSSAWLLARRRTKTGVSGR